MSQTMKRVLSLALAFVMVLGMFAPIAAFAETPEAPAIEETDKTTQPETNVPSTNDPDTAVPGGDTTNNGVSDQEKPAPGELCELPELTFRVLDGNGNVYDDPFTLKPIKEVKVSTTLPNYTFEDKGYELNRDNGIFTIDPEVVEGAVAQAVEDDVKNFTIQALITLNADEHEWASIIPKPNKKGEIYYNFNFEYNETTGCFELSGDAHRDFTIAPKNVCFHIRAVGENYVGLAGKTFEVFKLQQEVSKEGYITYKYNPKTGEALADEEYGVIATTEPTNKDGYTSVFGKVDPAEFVKDNGIKAGEYLGVRAKDDKGNSRMYMVNIWNQKEVQRFDLAGKVPNIEPKFNYDLVCVSDGQIAVVPFADLEAVIRVKVAVNGATPQLRYPIEGAKLALYKAKFDQLGQVLTTDKLELVKEGLTDEHGMYTFRVPFNPTVPVFAPEITQGEGTTVGTVGIHNVAVPYVLRQLDAGEFEGAKIVEYAITHEGTYRPGQAEPGSTQLAFLRGSSTKEADVEIFNDVDNFGPNGRIAGETRYETAVKIAEKTFPEGPASKTIVLAAGHNFPDALTGGVLAHLYNGPLLLTAKDKLPEAVVKYIEKYGINKAIILGGVDTISDDIVQELRGLSCVTNRVKGDNRYGTAVAVGDQIIRELNDGNSTKFLHGYYKDKGMIFLANGRDFSDALVASVPAIYYGAPILLTEADKLPQETLDAIARWNVKEVVLIGGTSSISKNVENQLTNVATQRYSGLNRQLTSMETAKAFFPQTTHAYFASGEQFADALAGALLAAKHHAPILLVGKDKVDPAIKEYIQKNGVTTGTILGGKSTVSTAVRDELAKIMTLRVVED